jgi:hypothetical protein
VRAVPEGGDKFCWVEAYSTLQIAFLSSILFISSFADFLSNLSAPLFVQVRYYSVALNR